MPKQIALFICLIFISWLFLRDNKLRPMTSPGLWLALIWISIVGSRPVSTWLGAQIHPDDPSIYLEGSPLDRAIFLFLIIAGTAVLLRRKTNWMSVFASNGWFFIFLFYCLISIFWSDYPFVSFKRWTKELGNIIMVLILLSEEDPIRATKAVLARYTYLAVPLSVVFIKYFPEIGRYYSNYTWTAAHSGVTTNKNELGAVLILCGLYLVWDLVHKAGENDRKKGMELFVTLVLFLMLGWLLAVAHSSTSAVCLVLGAGIIFFMRSPFGRTRARRLGVYSAAIGITAAVLFSFPDIMKSMAEMVGRDTTLTGRTELWSKLMGMAGNSLLGTGYKSFWLGPRVERMWDEFQFHPNQAHNGYLETYLDLGVIGLCLLIAVILSTGSKLRHEMEAGSSYSSLRFAFLFVAALYNWTEAMFNSLSLVWIMFVIAALSDSKKGEYRPALSSWFKLKSG